MMCGGEGKPPYPDVRWRMNKAYAHLTCSSLYWRTNSHTCLWLLTFAALESMFLWRSISDCCPVYTSLSCLLWSTYLFSVCMVAIVDSQKASSRLLYLQSFRDKLLEWLLQFHWQMKTMLVCQGHSMASCRMSKEAMRRSKNNYQHMVIGHVSLTRLASLTLTLVRCVTSYLSHYSLVTSQFPLIP